MSLKLLRTAAVALAAGFQLLLHPSPCYAESEQQDEVVAPVLLEPAQVDYPAGQAGDHVVVLVLTIDAQGRVTRVQVESGAAPFADTAAQAASSWRFAPARRGDVALAARIRFLVTFTEPTQAELPGAEPPPGEPPRAEPAQPAPAATASPEPTAPTHPEPIQVVVAGERMTSGQRLSRAEVRQLPGAFGDPFRAIESLPGVTPTLSGAPYFYVRGAPPGNLGLFLDQIRLPSLYHVFAGPPVIHPALLEDVEFYPGPYPARFGRAAGGVAAGRSIAATHALHGEASLRAFDASGLIELPLLDEQLSLIGAGRISYANPIAHLFAPDIFVSYWDYQAKLVSRASPEGTITAFAFGARDQLLREGDEGRVPIIDSEFHRVDVRYRHDSGDTRASMATTVGTDRSTLADGKVRFDAPLVSLRADLAQRLDDALELYAGAEGQSTWQRTELFEFDEPEERADYAERFAERLTQIGAAYLGVRWLATRDVHLDAGVRSDLIAEGDRTAWSVDPRLLVQYDVSPRLVLEHAVGIAHQPPGNPLPQPGATPALGDGLQTAIQSSSGFRAQLPGASLRVTGFLAVLSNLSDGPGVSRLDNGDDSVDENSRALGSTRGIEVLLSRSFSHTLGGYLAYTLSSSRRSLGRVEGPALFDRRHVLSAALGYRFGAGYSLGLRGAFYSGIPADVAYVEAAQNPPRTSPFHRVDVRAEKRWRLGSSGASWAVVLEMLNATLQKEELNKSCNAYVCRQNEVGPVAVPSLGLEANF